MLLRAVYVRAVVAVVVPLALASAFACGTDPVGV
jgi:hypothetical protein